MEPFKYLRYLDRFTTTTIITLLLLALAMPFIVANYQIFNLKAQTIYSLETINSGNWSDANIWSTKTVPKTGDTVLIAKDTTITYDALSDEVLAGITIEGTLTLSRTTNTRLKTSNNIMVMMGGFLDMGTASDPIPKTVKSELIFVLPQGKKFLGNDALGNPINMDNDTGLWVMDDGRWESHGATLVRTWSKLAADALKGAKELLVENDVKDWYVGGEIVVTGTSLASSTIEPQDETNTIIAIEPQAGGTTKLLLVNALQYTHSGTKFLPGDLGKGEVGLLTRNVLITTDITGVDETTLRSEGGSKSRAFAHTVYMMGSTGNLQYTEFRYLGHFAVLGRYPIHLHTMLDSSRGMVLRGNAITYTGHHVMNIHEANHVLIEDNVAYNIAGSGYFLEPSTATDGAGNPINVEPLGLANNIFIHNLGVGSIGYLNTPGMESERTAIFWTMGNTMELGNVASGGKGYGSQGFQPAPDSPGGGPYGKSPGVFVQNEAHGNKQSGLFTWSGSFRMPDDFAHFASWHNGTGFLWASYTAAWHLHQMKFVHNAGTQLHPVFNREYNVFDSLMASSGDPALSNQGFQIIKYVPPNHPPQEPQSLIRNTFLGNTNDISNFHDLCPAGDGSKEAAANGIPEEVEVSTSACPASYVDILGNQFSGVFDFGHTMNANTRWRILDYQGPYAADLPQHFWLHRKDQFNGSPTQTSLSAQVVTDQSIYYAPFDALVTSIVNPVIDYAPTVSLQMEKVANLVTLTATPTDDKGVNRVEFFQDWKLIDADMTPPYQVTVDLSDPNTLSTKRTDDTFIQFEAESGTLSGAATRSTASVSEVYGGQYINGGSSGGTATYTINVPKPGRYRLWGRGYFIGSGGSYRVTMDGAVNEQIILGTVQGAGSAVQQQWHWMDAEFEIGTESNIDNSVGKYYSLTAGPHTLTLTAGGSSLRLDSLVLAWDNTVFPVESPDMKPEYGSRKYTYFYARAYDGVIITQRQYEQRGYSNVVELGPEVLGASVPKPTVTTIPTISVPTPTPTSILIPTATSTSIPTSTPTPTPTRVPTATVVPTKTPTPTLIAVSPAPNPTLPIPTIALTPTPTPIPSPNIASLDKQHIFLDKVEKLRLSGENLRTTDLFIFRLKKGTITSLTLSNLKPLTSTTLEADLTSQITPSIPLGFYNIEIQRVSDGHKTTHTKQLLLTRLGDLWSSSATPTSEQPRDGKIDIFDVSRLLAKWKSTSPEDLLEADISTGPNNVSFGKIDIYDVNRLMANWSP